MHPIIHSTSLRMKCLRVLSVAATSLCCIILISCSSQQDGSVASLCKIGSHVHLEATRVAPRDNADTLKSPVVVLKCGMNHAGKLVELVGYDTSRGVCLATNILSTHATLGSLCASQKGQLFCPQRVLCVAGFNFLANSEDVGESLVTGAMTNAVTRVSVSGPMAKGKGRVHVLLARVTDVHILQSLHQARSFGYFAAFLPGCVVPKRVLIIAYGRNHDILGSTRGESFWPNPCRRDVMPRTPPQRKETIGGQHRGGEYRVTRVIG